MHMSLYNMHVHNLLSYHVKNHHTIMHTLWFDIQEPTDCFVYD